MAETNVTGPVPEPPGKWVAKVAAAVVLAAAVWSFIVSITSNLILPALARVMGGDPQSPLYLGKGDFNVPAIFSSILQLCLAGIAAALLYQWSQSAPRVRIKTIKATSLAAEAGIPSIAPAIATPPVAAPIARSLQPEPAQPQAAPTPPPAPIATQTPSVAASPTTIASPQPKPAPQPVVAAKPQKPKKPAEVYYNIVGEPINPTDND